MTEIFLINKNNEKLPIKEDQFIGIMVVDWAFKLEELEKICFEYLSKPKDAGSNISNKESAPAEYNTQGVHIHIHCPDCKCRTE